MMFRLLQRDDARGRIAVGVYFLRALQSTVGIRSSLTLGVLDRDGRRLVVKLRFDSLWSSRAAVRVGQGTLDLSLELRDLLCTGPAMSDVTAAEQSRRCSGEQPAEGASPPNGLTR
jgi:hypothetical protein